MGFLMPKPPAMDLSMPKAVPVPPLAQTADVRPKKKSMAPTFLGAEATPAMGSPSGMGGKTLLGQ